MHTKGISIVEFWWRAVNVVHLLFVHACTLTHTQAHARTCTLTYTQRHACAGYLDVGKKVDLWRKLKAVCRLLEPFKVPCLGGQQGFAQLS